MAEQLSGVNGNLIRWAREFYNMSEEEAARSIGVSNEKYSAWESGSEFPTYARLKKSVTYFANHQLFFSFLNLRTFLLSRAIYAHYRIQ